MAEQEIDGDGAENLIAVGKGVHQHMGAGDGGPEDVDIVDAGIPLTVMRDVRRIKFDWMSGFGHRGVLVFNDGRILPPDGPGCPLKFGDLVTHPLMKVSTR